MNDDREKFEIALPKEVKNNGGYISVFYTDDEYEIAFEGWQARGKHDRKELEELRDYKRAHSTYEDRSRVGMGLEMEKQRKELEASKQRIAELVNEKAEWLCTRCNVIHPMQVQGKLLQPCPVCGAAMLPTSFSIRRIEALEKKLATAEEHCELYAAEMSEAKEAGFYSASELYSAYKVMEKKLAEQQMYVKAINAKIAVYYGDNFTVSISASEELTKLLAAARKEGFEEGKQHAYSMLNCSRAYELGKQAGRDELQKELSEKEPAGWAFEYSGNSYYGHSARGGAGQIALIPRPLLPTWRGK